MPGHPNLQTPTRASELRNLAESMRNHHRSMKEQSKVIASELRRGLVPILGRTGAYRVGRQFAHAASQNDECARAYVRAHDIYKEIYEKRRKAATRFDPDA